MSTRTCFFVLGVFSRGSPLFRRIFSRPKESKVAAQKQIKKLLSRSVCSNVITHHASVTPSVSVTNQILENEFSCQQFEKYLSLYCGLEEKGFLGPWDFFFWLQYLRCPL